MFVHLRLHTEFSIVDGTIRIDEVTAAAVADGQPALAITDIGNLFGAIKFYQRGRSKGLKPILGAEVYVSSLTPTASPTRILLLAQNHRGYLNLCELLARAWTADAPHAANHLPACTLAWLQELGEGLIVLSGAQAGPVGQALVRGDVAGAEILAQELANLFPQRFYLEIQRAGRVDDEAHVVAAVQLAAQLQLPVVATHPVQFAKPEDYEAHEARVCIAEGELLSNPKRMHRFTHEQYFKSSAQMQALFADVPSALANTVEIAKRCNLTLTLGKPRLPDFPTPNSIPIEEYFRQACCVGLEERLANVFPDAAQREQQRARYQQRLAFELDTIVQMGFPGYFLIVGDFIQWAKNNGCPVGPGRGSGAGSLVAWSLKITDLDPLQYKLLFERFLNPERVSMPDFDIDFCQSNRDRVIDYVKEKYGKQAVSQIATFGTMAAKAAIRDVGRVMDMGYNFCDGISKLVPAKPGQNYTLAYPPQPKAEGDKNNYALELEPQLYERVRKEEEVRAVIEMAQRLEGLTRNIGMHAGGVLIAPGKLTDFCPLYQQPGSESIVSQYDKDDVEAVGLVKFDFLGLATLTILEIARQFICARHEGQAKFCFENVPLDDAQTYRLFADGKTEAVFQFESRGMQGMLREARPSRLEDLIALNALYRPGPMDLIPSFVARKHKREEVAYPHPLLESVLAETYGIMVYQEQVMQTAQLLGGYSLGAADMLRRAMGKKKPEEMAEHRAIFRKGAEEKGINQAKADEVFDLMEKFAGYGFNKSHAAAYSLLAYHTGWLKVHYTVEFYCANMTVEMDNTDKLRALYEDATRYFGITFEAPDINFGQWRFEPVSDNIIRYGLGAVKGTGQQAIEAIVVARDGKGQGAYDKTRKPFTSLFDFCVRVDRTRVNKRTVEALIKAGAFDRIHANRAELFASIDLAFDFAQAQHANTGQNGLFDMLGDDAVGSSSQEPALLPTIDWNIRGRLAQEKTAIGFYLSGHLFDEVAGEIRRFLPSAIAHIVASRDEQTVAGIVSECRSINSQRGRIMLFKLGDTSAEIEASVDENLLQTTKITDDMCVIVAGRLQQDHFSGGLRLKVLRIWDLPAARAHWGRYLRVHAHKARPDIAAIVREFPPRQNNSPEGEAGPVQSLPVCLELHCQNTQGAASVQVQLGQAARFYPSDAALARWAAQVGSGDKVHVVYKAESV